VEKILVFEGTPPVEGFRHFVKNPPETIVKSAKGGRVKHSKLAKVLAKAAKQQGMRGIFL